MKFKFILALIFAISVLACQDDKSDKPEQGGGKVVLKEEDGRKISVMAYNLENLFDDVKDGFPNETVLQTDVLHKKLSQLAKGILQINGVGPDILIVEEVENLNVLQELNRYLQDARYQTVELIEANDERGIDVGVFSRFPTAGKTVLHKMPFEDLNPTRGILEVTLDIGNSKAMHVFAVHFPSQANPVEQRRDAVGLLKNLMKSVSADAYAVAGGDFNITKVEEEKNRFFNDAFRDFKVSHLIGCGQCVGTYHFKGDWSFLDAVISRESMSAQSVRTPNQAESQLNADGSPKLFDKRTGLGISDHLPVYAEVVVSK